MQVFVHRLRKYIGAYLVHLKGQVDAFVWSAGIGENSAVIRKLAMADLEVCLSGCSCVKLKASMSMTSFDRCCITAYISSTCLHACTVVAFQVMHDLPLPF